MRSEGGTAFITRTSAHRVLLHCNRRDWCNTHHSSLELVVYRVLPKGNHLNLRLAEPPVLANCHRCRRQAPVGTQASKEIVKVQMMSAVPSSPIAVHEDWIHDERNSVQTYNAQQLHPPSQPPPSSPTSTVDPREAMVSACFDHSEGVSSI